MEYVITTNAKISTPAKANPTSRSVYVVTAANSGADRPQSVMIMNGVFLSSNDPLSNRQPLHNFTIPGSFTVLFFSGIQPTNVG